MIRRLLDKLFGKAGETDPEQDRLQDARIRRAQAFAAVENATARNDDRDLGRALMALQRATLDELRACR